MDQAALDEWTRLEDECDTQIDELLLPSFAEDVPAAKAWDQRAINALADVRKRRDAARQAYLDSLDPSSPPEPGATPPDTGSIVVLGHD